MKPILQRIKVAGMTVTLLNTVLFLGPALTLIMRGGYLILPLFVSLIGILLLLSKKVSINQAVQQLSSIKLIFVFFGYAAVNIFLNYFHGYPYSSYGMYIPFVLSPLMLIPIFYYKPDGYFFWLGAATGAIACMLLALVQVHFLDFSRAEGFTNPIKFGDSAIVLATAAFIGFIYIKNLKHPVFTRMLFLMGGFSGMFASLLSGSKGGWLSLAVVLVIVFFKISEKYSLAKKISMCLAIFSLFFILIFVGAKEQVIGRLMSGWHGATAWLESGRVTEMSVSIRLESWKVGLMIGAEHPLLGAGGRGSLEKMIEAVKAGAADPSVAEIRNFDNDLIGVFAEKGALGLATVLFVYIFTIKSFAKTRNDFSTNVKAMSLLGILIVFLFFEFGLSVAVFPIHIFRQIYTSWTMLLLGLIAVEISRRQEQHGLSPSGQDTHKI